jgi:hypothetical protein
MASQPPPSRSRQQEQSNQQTGSAPPPQQSQSGQTAQTEVTTTTGVKPSSGKTPGPKLEEAVVAAGRAGEFNIGIEMFPISMSYGESAYFIVKTAPGNAFEATLQQLEYKKSCDGVGTVKTSIIPLAPIGTKGKIVVRDTTTGESREQPWTWHIIGGGGGMGLWAMIKSLFVKSEQ